jgi:hypothetical protein
VRIARLTAKPLAKRHRTVTMRRAGARVRSGRRLASVAMPRAATIQARAFMVRVVILMNPSSARGAAVEAGHRRPRLIVYGSDVVGRADRLSGARRGRGLEDRMAESGQRVAALRECEQLLEPVWSDQPVQLIGIRMGGGHHSTRSHDHCSLDIESGSIECGLENGTALSVVADATAPGPAFVEPSEISR